MSDLLERLRALRGDAAPAPPPRPEIADARYEGAAVQLGATSVAAHEGVHLLRRVRLDPDARHGRVPIGTGGLHPWLARSVGGSPRDDADGSASPAARAGSPASVAESTPPLRVLYVDTETTGLAGGSGTYAFLIGAGLHDEHGFSVSQYFLPGPEHERSQLEAFAALARGADAVVTYNGASFDLPLLRARYALHRMDDPLSGVLHLDLLPVARRLWRSRLVDCTLGTVERQVLGARRSGRDVPGAEVPARYFAFLRSRDARPLRGVLEHNHVDIVALAALRTRVEGLLHGTWAADADESHALGRWLERLGEHDEALARYGEAGHDHPEAVWDASLLLRRLGRIEDAERAWRVLADRGRAAAWVELAKVQEHRLRDYEAALASVEAAARCADARDHDLPKRRERLLRRLGARGGGLAG